MSSSDDDSSRSSNDNNSERGNNDDDYDESQRSAAPPVEEADDNTLRVLISTDNHLGYLENDPIRGFDSFAAFEEVLYLAKRVHKVDCVLLGGDLFHHNKPSRRTLHRTMLILRRYAMGPDPVKIQILSDQRRDFQSAPGCVNYEDPNYSVDLPIFSIHGNHDDPTRDGGPDLLAALDLLAVNNLINYFGRQDAVDKVEVSPVLIQKGSTRVALYGLGNMRDERLNRMWNQKKVRFLRPENAQDRNDNDDDDDEDDADGEQEWFNIFVLHQNRDNVGRGAKNCIHESMIPNWMDLTVFGHEHDSQPHPAESVVGTFRITQPGSSVATSLTDGESARKHAIVMDVRGSQFRMEPIPLTQVRSFMIKEVSLSDHENINKEDPKVDQKITRILEEELNTLMVNARDKHKQLLKDAISAGNFARTQIESKYKMKNPELPLLRLKVEHTGFGTLNNQRFGAKFVGKVGNPNDILMFSKARSKTPSSKSSGKGGKKKKSSKDAAADALEEPVEPTELEQTSIEDLVKQSLMESEQTLEVLKSKDLANALEDFVDKQDPNAIPDAAEAMIKKRQKLMLDNMHSQKKTKNKGDDSMDQDDSMEQQDDSMMDDRDDSMMMEDSFESTATSAQKNKRKRSTNNLSDESDNDSIDKENQKSSRGGKGRGGAKKKSSTTSSSRSKKDDTVDLLSDDDDDDDDDDDINRSATQSSRKSTSSSRASTTGRGKKSAPARTSSGDIRGFFSRNSQASQATTASNKRGRNNKKNNRSSSQLGDSDDSDIEVVAAPAPAPASKRSSPRRRTNKGKVNYSMDNGSDDDDDGFMDDSSREEQPVKKKRGRGAATTSSKSSRGGGRSRKSTQDSFDLDDDWGTASTRH